MRPVATPRAASTPSTSATLCAPLPQSASSVVPSKDAPSTHGSARRAASASSSQASTSTRMRSPVPIMALSSSFVPVASARPASMIMMRVQMSSTSSM